MPIQRRRPGLPYGRARLQLRPYLRKLLGAGIGENDPQKDNDDKNHYDEVHGSGLAEGCGYGFASSPVCSKRPMTTWN